MIGYLTAELFRLILTYTNTLSMNWILIVVTGVLAISLISFLIIRNKKDEKEFEKQPDEAYFRIKDSPSNIEEDDSL